MPVRGLFVDEGGPWERVSAPAGLTALERLRAKEATVDDLRELLPKLLAVYDAVLLPFGNGRRYDMVVDTGNRFLRIQCKTGRLAERLRAI